MNQGKKISPNIITKENIGISMWELNKVHNMGMQSMGDKENEEVIHNRLKYFTNSNLIHPYILSTFTLYNQCNTIVQ